MPLVVLSLLTIQARREELQSRYIACLLSMSGWALRLWVSASQSYVNGEMGYSPWMVYVVCGLGCVTV